MKKLNRVFLRKSEVLLLRFSIIFALFGVSSKCEFQIDLFQRVYFGNKILFS